MTTYGKRSKTKNVATGRFTLCQARASLRPFNIAQRNLPGQIKEEKV